MVLNPIETQPVFEPEIATLTPMMGPLESLAPTGDIAPEWTKDELKREGEHELLHLSVILWKRYGVKIYRRSGKIKKKRIVKKYLNRLKKEYEKELKLLIREEGKCQ